ncbi:hypothetical protein J7443_17540 [Tropicibacter sp. R15_0]|uniref:hypothetical protein n=1 Tax=Tropicibacter sp. R15_0 TaxID=2821101 RepID=UPI001ADB8586|nr:hypothetical protein [Tropicibacter sp. R15_0]MBO9467051.1 hypothetical protein [Tropicibacter sp. R15_0]
MGPQKVAALIEWTHYAKSINQEANPELSEAWRCALTDIFDENFELIGVLSKFSEQQVKLLSEGGKVPTDFLDRAANLGLLSLKVQITNRLLRFLFNEIANFLLILGGFTALLLVTSIIFREPAFEELVEGNIAYFVPAGLAALLAKLFLKKHLSHSKVGKPTHKGAYILERLGKRTNMEYFE